MKNKFSWGLFTISFLYCAGLSTARQISTECAKGPEYWCKSLKQAADCGAVGHCIGTEWEGQDERADTSILADKFIHLFRKLKDVKEMINDQYLQSRVLSTCHDISSPRASALCLDNTAGLGQYLNHVLQSAATPETMCRIIGMCLNPKLDVSKKKGDEGTLMTTEKPTLLGGSRCTWGPSYWCSNFSTGRECKATHHCVQRVWSKVSYPQDDDGICQICKDMVKQARDQLESNETQEELKEVFEGSCKFIPIKLVAKECIKMADDFVPELVETLASQMNPDAVCSVAGLCNNAHIDKLIEEYNATLKLREECTNCKKAVGIVRKRFDETQYDDFLVGLLKVCQNVGSLSDSCSMLVFKYYENIVAALKMDFTADKMCHFSGQCACLLHIHNLYTFPEETLVLKATDDVPCEFCEQVVKHMRDTLIANTTEVEFHKILVGLCKQTGSFRTECLQLVEQYHSTFYYFLVSGLKPAELCGYIGICTNKSDTPVAPLLPTELAVKAFPNSMKLLGDGEPNTQSTPKGQANVKILGEEKSAVPPLPIERMFVAQPQDNGWCSFCQYFLHYIQVELSDDATEAAITKAVEQACDILPNAVEDQCRQFVTQYGPAVIALLVHEVDPSTICPSIGLCAKSEEVHGVSINSEKSNCPLCLFAVEQLETVLKNNRSEENIRHALDGLCTRLSAKLRTECVDFVDTYTNQLIEMLVADLNPQEICVYLKRCKDDIKRTDPLQITHSAIDKYHEKPYLRGDRNNRKRPMLPKHMLETGVGGDIETNEIPDYTSNGRPIGVTSPKTVCVMCEFVLKEIDDQIKDKHNDDEIKNIVHGVCKRMPKSVRSECDKFVEKYADLVISLLAQELNPDEVCRELKLCDTTAFNTFREEILDCAVCETVVMAVKKVLANDKVDRNIVHVVEKACNALPAKYYNRCHTMLEVYGESVIHLIETFGTKGVCQKIGLCSSGDAAFVRMYRTRPKN